MVVPIKTSNITMMVTTVRLLVRVMAEEGIAYPLHLGVTKAGDAEDGRIKSAVGIGALLADGDGDTVVCHLPSLPRTSSSSLVLYKGVIVMLKLVLCLV